MADRWISFDLANLTATGPELAPDGVREYANGGVQACAESAKLAVEQVTERFGPPVGSGVAG